MKRIVIDIMQQKDVDPELLLELNRIVGVFYRQGLLISQGEAFALWQCLCSDFWLPLPEADEEIMNLLKPWYKESCEVNEVEYLQKGWI